MGSYLDKDEAFGFIDKRRARGSAASVLATPGSYVSDATLEARLAAVNAGYFTAARLAQMTHNDKVMAVRAADDSAGIK